MVTQGADGSRCGLRGRVQTAQEIGAYTERVNLERTSRIGAPTPPFSSCWWRSGAPD